MNKKLDLIGKATETTDLIWVTDFTGSAASKFAASVLKAAQADESKPIVVYVDSYGGEIDGLNAMLSVMDSVPNPFITVAVGKAMSAGAVLLSHGDFRCVGSQARVMIHEASGGFIGQVQDMKVTTEETERINKQMMGLLAKNCNKSPNVLKKMFEQKRDIFFTPTQAVKFGIADKVGIPLIEQGFTFQMRFSDGGAKASKKSKKSKK